jgi:methanogenic corrinoid protein MtbC1
MNCKSKQIIDELQYLKEILLKFHFDLNEEIIRSFLEEAIEKLDEHYSLNTRTFIESDNYYALQYLNYVLRGDRDNSEKYIFDLLSEGKSVYDIYQKIFMPVQYEVGNKWLKNEISVADEHLATNITLSVIHKLEELLDKKPRNGRKLIATTVGKELHSMGIKFVCDFFRLDGMGYILYWWWNSGRRTIEIN